MKLLKYSIPALCTILLCLAISRADTLYLKDGEEVKGIVVENYRNSIVLSTVYGEKSYEKSSIKDILYDRKEQNLVKLGDYYQDNGNLPKAYAYYEKAYNLNPEYKEAKDKFIHIRSMLLRNPEKQFEDDIARRRAFFKESGRVYKPEIDKQPPTRKQSFEKATGLLLVSDKGMPRVVKVMPRSAAEEGGIRAGDIIVSIWGRLTGYMDAGSIIDMVLDSASPEIVLSVKRGVKVSAPVKQSPDMSSIGIQLTLLQEGLTIGSVKPGSAAERAGLRKGDIITDVNGEPVRYMPFSTVKEKISGSLEKGAVGFGITRDIIMWRKGE